METALLDTGEVVKEIVPLVERLNPDKVLFGFALVPTVFVKTLVKGVVDKGLATEVAATEGFTDNDATDDGTIAEWAVAVGGTDEVAPDERATGEATAKVDVTDE